MHYFLAIYTSKTNYLMPGNGRFALKNCRFTMQKTLFYHAKGYISSLYVNKIYLKD